MCVYVCIIRALCDSSHNLIPVVGTTGNFQPIAWWNDYVKTAHLKRSNTKPKFGPICDIMNSLDVKHAINQLKIDKSAGTDSMQGEHFKYAHSKVTGLLSMLFNAVFLHNYLPCKLMETCSHYIE